MKLIHRFAYYFSGFFVGILLLIFFLSGKKTSCAYGPNARVLKHLRVKNKIINDEVFQVLSNHNLDTSAISEVLVNGNVLFSESLTDRDTCQEYMIEGNAKQLKTGEKLKIKVENCDTVATVLNAFIVKAVKR